MEIFEITGVNHLALISSTIQQDHDSSFTPCLLPILTMFLQYPTNLIICRKYHQ